MLNRPPAQPDLARRARLTATGLTIGAFIATAVGQPLFPNSVASNDIDFITDADPSTFVKLEFVTREPRDMVDKRPGASEEPRPAFVFDAHFSDHTIVVIAIDAAFESQEAAHAEALRYVHPLGKLPTVLRDGIINGMIVHRGGEDTTAFSDGGRIILYSDNATKRIGNHDLEETIFHESIHVALDRKHARSAEWLAAQAADGAFITEYAQKRPRNEDLAESALFVYTLLHHPERLPAGLATRIQELIPNRIAYISRLLPAGEPIFKNVEPPPPTRKPGSAVRNVCLLEINLRGVLSDVLSNCLRMDFGLSSTQLKGDARGTSEELFQAVAIELKLDPEKLRASVLRHQHVNCKHAPGADESETIRTVAQWKAPSAEQVAAGARTAAAPPIDPAVAAQSPSDMHLVAAELRWISWILIAGVLSNVVLVALQLFRPHRGSPAGA